jgi:hypothetical protein
MNVAGGWTWRRSSDLTINRESYGGLSWAVLVVDLLMMESR